MEIAFDAGIFAVGPYVVSFNTRTGAVTLLNSDVIAALGFTPENSANKATNFVTVNNTLYPTIQAVVDYIASLPPGGVASFNTRTGAVTLLSADVIAALGYTPAVAGSGVTSFNTRTGAVVLLSADVIAATTRTGTGTTFALSVSPAFTGTVTAAAITATGTQTVTNASAPVRAFINTGPATLGGIAGRIQYLPTNGGGNMFIDALYNATGRLDFVIAGFNGIGSSENLRITDAGVISIIQPAVTASGFDVLVIDTTTNVIKKITGGLVNSFNTRTGAVTLLNADVVAAISGTKLAGYIVVYNGSVAEWQPTAGLLTPISISTAPALGAGGTVNIIGGGNFQGIIEFTTGAAPSGGGGTIFTVNLNGFSYPTSCVPVISPNNFNAGAASSIIGIGNLSSFQWQLEAYATLTPLTTYRYTYHIGGY